MANLSLVRNTLLYTAGFSLHRIEAIGTVLAEESGQVLELGCGDDGLLVSPPQRLTISWSGDSFDLFAVPATLEVDVGFPSDLSLRAVVTEEITF